MYHTINYPLLFIKEKFLKQNIFRSGILYRKIKLKATLLHC